MSSLRPSDVDKKWFVSICTCHFVDFSLIVTACRNLSNQYDPNISGHTLVVFIFLLGIHMCALLSSPSFIFPTAGNLSIFGMQAHQHSTTSSEHQEAFQLEADESTGLEKEMWEGKLGSVWSHCSLGRSFPGCRFPTAHLSAAGAPVPSWLCSSHSTSPLSGHHRGQG